MKGDLGLLSPHHEGHGRRSTAQHRVCESSGMPVPSEPPDSILSRDLEVIGLSEARDPGKLIWPAKWYI